MQQTPEGIRLSGEWQDRPGATLNSNPLHENFCEVTGPTFNEPAMRSVSAISGRLAVTRCRVTSRSGWVPFRAIAPEGAGGPDDAEVLAAQAYPRDVCMHTFSYTMYSRAENACYTGISERAWACAGKRGNICCTCALKARSGGDARHVSVKPA